jgi:hypothetical protein
MRSMLKPGGTVTGFIRERWADDAVTPLVLRAAASPASRPDASWAGVLAQAVIGDFVSSLAPISAAAKLFNAAPSVSLDAIMQLNFPARSGPISPTVVPWVDELDPMPVIQYTLAHGVTLGPSRKLGVITVVTNEVASSSNAETVVTTLLRENAALALDATLFSNLAATSARPAGILAGLTPLTAATGVGDEAMLTDLSALAAAVGSVATGLAFVGHPNQISAIKIRRGSMFPADIELWPTLGVAAGTVIAIAPEAFASAFGSVAEIESSKEVTMLMDSAPGPNLMAGPTRSMFQTDCIATKLRLRAAWCMRAPAVAFVTGTTW